LGNADSPPCDGFHGEKMKLTLRLIGALGVIIGAIWILQGIDVLPGSFMSGQTKWAVNGVIATIVGAAIIVSSFFFKKKST
jgi:hypothetical protein